MRRPRLQSSILVVLSVFGTMVFGTPAHGARIEPKIGAVAVVTGVDLPDAFTVDPAGRLFYVTAWVGQVHLYDPATGSDAVFFTFTGTGAPLGILGVTLAPGYPTSPFVYVYLSRTIQGSPKIQIVRLRDSGGIGTQPKAIYQSEVGTEHSGGRMLFGSDGMLYVVTGDAGDPANSQDLTNNLGKMLRMTPTGMVPPGNPFGTLVWAYGLRNSFGWDFDPQTGMLWESDNGPECNDEINLVRKGRNYAWGPSESCLTPPPPPRNTNQDGPNPVLPVEYMAEPTAPTGVAFCQGCGLPASEGTMFYGNYNTLDIHQVVLTADRRHIASDTSVFTHTSIVLSLETGPDGTIYFSDDTAIYKLVGS
jgi:glucose/arabinose dehydrogenase